MSLYHNKEADFPPYAAGRGTHPYFLMNLRILIGIGAAILVFGSIVYVRKRWERIFRNPEPDPQPDPQPDPDPQIVSGVSVLLTFFEQDQSLLIDDLTLGEIHDTAFDTVVEHRAANTDTGVVYLLPPLLEAEQGLRTWALLEGTRLPETEDIVFKTHEKTETFTLQAAHAKLLDADAEVYLGINLAVVPLSETHRDAIRESLLRLREKFGENFHIRKLNADILADWPTQTRNTRNAIWKQLFNGVSRQTPIAERDTF